MDIIGLKEKLKRIADPRRQYGNLRHKLVDIFVIGLGTLLCEGKDFEDMEVFGRSREAELRKLLELPHGIPDESTFFRVFTRVNPKELSSCLYEWLTEAHESTGKHINIDGKAIRGSGKGEKPAVHVVSAWVGDEEIVLGQLAVDEKSNEITAIPKLLDLFDIKDATITIDAMGCQTAIAEKIARKGATYVLAVKDNQPNLNEGITDYFEGLEQGAIRDVPEDIWVTEEETGHGRVEKREVRTVTDLDWLPEKEKWKDLQTIIQYRSFRTIHGEMKETDRYYISNADMSAEEFYRCIREHWSIENNLHWSLDVIFGEDAAHVTKDHGPENLNIMRKMALSLLRAAPSPRPEIKRKFSGPKKRFAAALNPDYMLTVLFHGK
ncbi:putative transposase YncI [Spirochaetia bacterium]|nr:putative transposase YncI [Spirochaetia bacterium]